DHDARATFAAGDAGRLRVAAEFRFNLDGVANTFVCPSGFDPIVIGRNLRSACSIDGLISTNTSMPYLTKVTAKSSAHEEAPPEPLTPSVHQALEAYARIRQPVEDEGVAKIEVH